ncbi:putative Ubiquitinconjugating enzyme subfamily protein [Paratrimastix pyriformis]|uniref:Ubiquitinconjugating enzyme subfamily protein n=1 Tax=Paratrimastix pyriformis TaxID=342808 RepID=A0ABQ8UK41_9EUKA|nr:putative Ubiquitinconjugating enzyme subfamily protein [Paratrimastix pyriformis]|eukprot:GAFH01000704.1.p1 GENE.GAFH01000704.1~~GAFH01000704.1.p1  ORF type:complete len:1491 (-),score=756.41 GAFH01000704.1:152-4591(-)
MAQAAAFITPPRPDGVRQSTVQRLFTDLKEVQNCKLPTISALPLEDNLMEWHCNLVGPEKPKWAPYSQPWHLTGALFHIVLNFPADYPDSPPTLRLCTSLPHPNVFGNTLCLDMLTEFKEKYQGWSPAYSALSILLQLQSFLFKYREEDTEAQLYSREMRQAVDNTKSYECTGCRHRPGRPWPPVEKVEANLPPVPRITRLRQQLTCYYSRRTFEEDCLGVGLCINRNIRTGRILSVTSPLDLVSLRSYMRHGVRRSAYNEAFSHWIPIYISPEHAQKAIPMARNAISTICKGHSKKFEPLDALEVLASLMRSMVVEMLLDHIHVSTKSLTGFCWFYRMLVEMGRIHPEIPKLAREKVDAFMADETNRHKDAVPDMGQFMAMWLISGRTWAELQGPLLEERWARDVFWIIKKYPELAKIEDPKDPAWVDDEDRAVKSFVASANSLRHVAFFAAMQKRFIGPLVPMLDENLGALPPAVEESMLKMCHEILSINGYDEFFRFLGEAVPTKERLCDTLRASVANSQRRGYHEKQLEVTSVEDAARQEQEKIRPLESFLVAATGPVAPAADDAHWKENSLRCLLGHLPAGIATWRELYAKVYQGPVEVPAGTVRVRLALSHDAPAPLSLADLADEQGWRKQCISSLVIAALPEGVPTWWDLYIRANMTGPAPPAGHLVMTSDERLWQRSCARFGIKQLPEGEATWRDLYIRMNLQEYIQKLNDNPDFGKLYLLLALSKDYITQLTWITFTPDRIQSRHHFLTQLLTDLPNLRHFRVMRHSCDLHPNACKAITKGLKNRPDGLRELDISMTNAQPLALVELIPGLLATTQLRTLNLSFNPLAGHLPLTKLLAKFIRRHPTLEVLMMNSCGLTDSEAMLLAPALEFHTTLRRFEIQRNHLSPSGLGSLLYNVGFIPTVTAIDCSAIAEAAGRAGGSQLSPGEAMARMLEISKSLSSMNCWKTPFTYSERLFDALAHNRSLKFLDLGDTAMPNEFAERLGRALVHNNTLVELNLERNQLSMQAFYHLCKPGVRDARGFSVEVLRMNGNNLSQTITIEKRPVGERSEDDDDEGTQEVLTAADMLRVFKKLRVLELKSSSLTPQSGAIVGGLLATRPDVVSAPIERLVLALNNLGREGTAAIAASLATNTTLRHLDLSRNRLGVAGARSIAAVLGANHPLEELNLFGNGMGVEGCREIATALHHNTHLKVLDLGMNRVRDKGAQAVAVMLRANSTLHTLKMRLNLIAQAGAQALIEAICTQGEVVESRHGHPAAEGPATAAAAVAAQSDAASETSSEGARRWGNQTLRTLLLNNNPIPNEGIMVVCGLLRESKHPMTLDLVKRLAEADPERRQLTVWVSPLPSGCSSDEVARFFYANKTGAIRNISICQVKRKKAARGGRSPPGKRFAFVEFVDENSVELALHLPPKGLAQLRGKTVSIARTGVRSGRSVDNMERAKAPAGSRGGRGGGRGGRGGRRGGRGRGRRMRR